MLRWTNKLINEIILFYSEGRQFLATYTYGRQEQHVHHLDICFKMKIKKGGVSLPL